jgi:hypothetical protein
VKRSAVLIFAVSAAASIVLVVNVILLGHATTGNDPVGRLTPSSTLVRAHPSNQPRPAWPREAELPDD